MNDLYSFHTAHWTAPKRTKYKYKPAPKPAPDFSNNPAFTAADCLSVPKLPDGPKWTYEILCHPLHKISSVAFGVMWRCCFSAADKAHGLLRSAT
jgi:hypothetical protein